MSGTRIDTAKSGVLHCIGQLTDLDYIGILLFGSKTRVLFQGFKKDFNRYEFNRVSADGGGTALYDAIVEGGAISLKIHIELKKMIQQSAIDAISYVVVLTDGDDCDSRLTARDVIAFLATVNAAEDFKIIMAGIQLGPKARGIMQSFGAVGNSNIEFRELRSNADITELFEHVTIQITQTTNTIVASSTGDVLAVQKKQTLNLNNGNVTTSTKGALTTQLNSPLLIGQQSPASSFTDVTPNSGNRVKLIPSKTSDFWDPDYDLNVYELISLARFVIFFNIIFLFFIFCYLFLIIKNLNLILLNF